MTEKDKAREKMRALYGKNKKIMDGDYDKSLAVKCINGTFVGKKNGNVIAYKGIPFGWQTACRGSALEGTGGCRP